MSPDGRPRNAGMSPDDTHATRMSSDDTHATRA